MAYNAGVGGSNPSPPTTRTSRSVHAFEVFGEANRRSARREIQQKSNMRLQFHSVRGARGGEIQQNPTRAGGMGAQVEPGAGFVLEGNADDLRFRGVCWSARGI
jgi:hypothetical protein